jgi:hypothetical protein
VAVIYLGRNYTSIPTATRRLIVIDRFMRVLDWVAFIYLILISALISAFAFTVIYDGRDFSKLFDLALFLILYIFIKIIIYIVQGTWRWFPWSK